jgi:hypothetical protein
LPVSPDFATVVASCQLILRRAAHDDWPAESLEQFLQQVRGTGVLRSSRQVAGSKALAVVVAAHLAWPAGVTGWLVGYVPVWLVGSKKCRPRYRKPSSRCGVLSGERFAAQTSCIHRACPHRRLLMALVVSAGAGVSRWGAQVHEVMRRKSVPTQELDGFNWRVDVKTTSRRSSQINEPSAVLEFATSDQGTQTGVVRCEADREMVASVLQGIATIKANIAKLSS